MDTKTKMKTVIFALVLIILSFIGLYLNNKYNDDELIKIIINLVSTSIITSALFTIIISIFSRNYFEEAFRDLISNGLPFINRLTQKGLVEFEEIFPLKNDVYENDFRDSETVTIIMNDAKKFFSNNITLFRSRFSRKNKTTNIILLDPESNDSISVLTRKNGHEGDYYKNKINDFVKELIAEQIDYKSHKIKIYVHNLYTTMAVILTDKYALVSLYRISPGKDDVPHLVFKKNQNNSCEYNKIRKDVENLINFSREIKKMYEETTHI
jgi:hypothetical protein